MKGENNLVQTEITVPRNSYKVFTGCPVTLLLCGHYETNACMDVNVHVHMYICTHIHTHTMCMHGNGREFIYTYKFIYIKQKCFII